MAKQNGMWRMAEGREGSYNNAVRPKACRRIQVPRMRWLLLLLGAAGAGRVELMSGSSVLTDPVPYAY